MSVTPLRRQYLKIKQRYPHAIVFFRLGDFYETFDDDAGVTSRELEITLTSREMGKGQRVPMAGIPYHSIDNYLAKLISKGFKVAICEQLSPPGKGLVDRDVVRVITPGTVIEPGLLVDKKNNFLVGLIIENNEVGIAYVDVTTGEFYTSQMPITQFIDELERLQPAEIIVPKEMEIDLSTTISVTRIDNYWFEFETAYQVLLEQFKVVTVEGYGCAHLPLAIRAAGAVIHYIAETQVSVLAQINKLSTYSTQAFMIIDGQTRRNLELFSSSRWGTMTGSLLSVIDWTKTAMGGRMLKKWMGQPLLDIEQLIVRQEYIAWFHQNGIVRQEIISILAEIVDLERLINRIRIGIAIPRDLIAFKTSLQKMTELKSVLEKHSYPMLLLSELKSQNEIVVLIEKAIADEPSSRLEYGDVIKAGFSSELDNVRNASMNAKKYLANLEGKERERTGIKSLKVGYNRVFGYYIEISKSNLDHVPENYIRKQTITNGERFFTPELKEYESQILNAQEMIKELETTIFRQVCQQIASFGERILLTSKILAEVDVYSSLAEVAVHYCYVRPELNDDNTISIKGGRHPIVEQSQKNGSFVPNDLLLCNDDTQLIILTGPNMSGKSTFLKQVALIVFMAQIGSFIPAEWASIGLVDRIFTRIGAQEDLAAGQSTFMVEMIETATILNNATSKSLIILDEVGRGTSTFDGLAIAWAIVEFIHNNPRLGTKTLFATHYHELINLAQVLPHVRNYNVAVTEERGQIVFLRKIIPGGADKSYGIHVAQLASMPTSVIHRAQEVLITLENSQSENYGRKNKSLNLMKSQQLALFNDSSQLISELARCDVDSMSPLEAINKLYELKKKASNVDTKCV